MHVRAGQPPAALERSLRENVPDRARPAVRRMHPRGDARGAQGGGNRPIATSDSTIRSCRRRSTTRTPDSLVAELADGRIVNVSYRPTQNGSWVSTHEDITERTQNEARIAHLAFHDQLTGLPNRAAFNEHIAKTFQRAVGRQ